MKLFSLAHLGMLLLVAASVAVLCIVGAVRSRGDGDARRMGAKLGYVLLLFWIIYNTYYLAPSQFSWSVSLPLHVCDLIGLFAALAMITANKQMRALLYFTSISLTTQALITPAGVQDPASLRFWLYWTMHGGILAAAFFDLLVCAYRPSLRDLLFVIMCTVVYVGLMFPINVWFGWNYGYIGAAKPDQSTLIDILGPWPARVLVITALAIAMETLMLLPWAAVKYLKRQPHTQP